MQGPSKDGKMSTPSAPFVLRFLNYAIGHHFLPIPAGMIQVSTQPRMVPEGDR